MYAGQIVEQGTVDEVLLEPRAPYTMGLIESIPTVEKRGGRLSVISGVVPIAVQPAAGLPVRAALPVRAGTSAGQVPPELYAAGGPGQLARCHLHTPEGEGRRQAAARDAPRRT